MINHGFTETQQYIDKRLEEIQGNMAAKDELNDVKQMMKDVLEELNATHEDVRYIRTTVIMLVRNDAAQDATINTLTARVTRLEKKDGLAT